MNNKLSALFGNTFKLTLGLVGIINYIKIIKILFILSC
jgi:hypothetical protein